MTDEPATPTTACQDCGRPTRTPGSRRCRSCHSAANGRRNRRLTLASYRVDPVTGCWIWLGSPDSNGYGRYWRDGRPVPAHRAVYEAKVGPIPPGKQFSQVCPAGQIPLCVNPAHWEPVSRAVVIQRQRNRKLRPEDAPAIRQLAAAGTKQQDIAERFGVSQETVSAIVCGRRWRSVP